MKVLPVEIRAAKKFLQAKKLQDVLPANKFALAAKELDVPFKEVLSLINEESEKDG